MVVKLDMVINVFDHVHHSFLLSGHGEVCIYPILHSVGGFLHW
jgi:hypothetical protein